MENHIQIGKLDAAKRHLAVAIRMFFERKDPIVVYSVSWSAYQIFSDMCKKNGIHRQIEDHPVIKELGVKKEVMAAFRAPRNFFHHADKDPEKFIKFFPDMSFLMPMLATDLCEKLVSEPFWPGRVMQVWFYFKYPERAPEVIKSQMKAMQYQPKHDEYEYFLELLEHVGA